MSKHDDVRIARSPDEDCRLAIPPRSDFARHSHHGAPRIADGKLQRAFGRLVHHEDWPTRAIPKVVAKTGAWLMNQLPSGDEAFIKPFMIDLADDHYALDTSRARELLGWTPRHSLRETLPRVIDAMKRDPAAWYRANKLKSPADLAASRAVAEEGHVE